MPKKPWHHRIAPSEVTPPDTHGWGEGVLRMGVGNIGSAVAIDVMVSPDLVHVCQTPVGPLAHFTTGMGPRLAFRIGRGLIWCAVKSFFRLRRLNQDRQKLEASLGHHRH